MARYYAHPERHLLSRIGWLRAAVLGANDGIVSTASLIVGVAAAIGTVTMLRQRDMAYGLVLLWAFTGILIKHMSTEGFGGRYPEVIATTIACLVVFLVAEFLVWRGQRRAMA